MFGYLSIFWLKHTKYEESLCFVLYAVDVNAKKMHESRHRFVKVELELSEVEVIALLWLLKYDAVGR